MSSDLPFLAHLGLGPDATLRDVRRAYAQQLRRIDPATDPQAFQALRAAYEAALRWLEGAGAEAPGPDDVSAARRPPPSQAREPGRGRDRAPTEEAAAPASAKDAAAAMAELRRALPGFAGMSDARAALEAHLASARLEPLEARLDFEVEVAALLASGWAPGHHHLLPAADEVFRWSKDRGRLAQLGRAGPALDAALEELAVYARMDGSFRFPCDDALALLRARERPPHQELLRLMSVLQRLSVRFPAWVPLVAPAPEIDRWRAWYQELPSDRRVYVPPRVRLPMSRRTQFLLGVLALVAPMVVIGIAQARCGRAGQARSSRVAAALPWSPEQLEEKCGAGDDAACKLLSDLMLEPGSTIRMGKARALPVFRRACELGSYAACQARDTLERLGEEEQGGMQGGDQGR